MGGKTNKTIIIFMVIFILILSSCSISDPQKDKEEITKTIKDYFSGLSSELRPNGVSSIDINSTEINLAGKGATAKLNITFKIYYPSNGEKREDKDSVTIGLKKTKDNWRITETKYQKTRW